MKITIVIWICVLCLTASCGKKDYNEMVFVKGGQFTMGSNDIDADPDEDDMKLVSINDFYIGRYEVTQAEWNEIMEENLSVFQGKNHPVECVSWDDANLFIKRLNERTGRHYRLPTHEEWEYAAKGGQYANKCRYSGGNNLNEVGWMRDNSRETTHKVGLLKPNALGLYDMTGNVHEWCDGLYDSLFYAQDTLMNKEYDLKDIRIFKGGCWGNPAKYCRISNINYHSRETRSFSIGFRLAEDVITKNNK